MIFKHFLKSTALTCCLLMSLSGQASSQMDAQAEQTASALGGIGDLIAPILIGGAGAAGAMSVSHFLNNMGVDPEVSGAMGLPVVSATFGMMSVYKKKAWNQLLGHTAYWTSLGSLAALSISAATMGDSQIDYISGLLGGLFNTNLASENPGLKLATRSMLYYVLSKYATLDLLQPAKFGISTQQTHKKDD